MTLTTNYQEIVEEILNYSNTLNPRLRTLFNFYQMKTGKRNELPINLEPNRIYFRDKNKIIRGRHIEVMLQKVSTKERIKLEKTIFNHIFKDSN